jgi:hypothetical protein
MDNNDICRRGSGVLSRDKSILGLESVAGQRTDKKRDEPDFFGLALQPGPWIGMNSRH